MTVFNTNATAVGRSLTPADTSASLGATTSEEPNATEWSDLARVLVVSVVIGVPARAIAGTASRAELITARTIAEALGRQLVRSAHPDRSELPDDDPDDRWPSDEYTPEDRGS